MSVSTKKRLGQYFSGDMIADVLVSISNPSADADVIDPMAGSGDMLAAASRFGVPTSKLYGVEIDTDVALQCEARNIHSKVINSDAFSLDYFESFGKTSWDLVITNPPYVRYQSLATSEGSHVKIKTSKEIRDGLCDVIRKLNHLSNEDKNYFLEIADSYSGLSDLAVPSWILCAALVKDGGTLAMVVPESWINRDYAVSIKYLLLKLFDIQCVIEDINAAWFADALVKTNLVVAKRVPLKSCIQKAANQTFRQIRLSSKLIGETSLVDKLCYHKTLGLDALRHLINSDEKGDGFESKSVSLENFVSNVLASKHFSKVSKATLKNTRQKVNIPDDLAKVIKPLSTREMTNLDSWNFTVGQGLRTGANKFFYAECSSSNNDFEWLRVNDTIQLENVCIPKVYSLPTLRYQSDISDKYKASADMLAHRLIYIYENVFDTHNNPINNEHKPLANYINAADRVTFLKGGKATRFRDLSAVKPNIRSDGSRNWYMLPMLSRRHQPQLCMSRVNYKSPRCLFVQEGVIVDANFSTLWTESKDLRLTYALLALLNSQYVQACLEINAAIMGGGALKVEATHIRAIPVPIPNEKIIALLHPLGEQLSQVDTSSSAGILRQIDEVILGYCFEIDDPLQAQRLLEEFVSKKEAERKR